MHLYTAETQMGLNENVVPQTSSTAANQSMIARSDSSVAMKCNRMYSL